MYYDPDINDHGLPFNPIKGLVAPRPIGWISSISKDGVGNLAPYSFFNMLSYNPAYLMFSAGCKENGSKKDSVVNIEQTGEFVFNMAHWDTRTKMSDTSWIDDPKIDELLECGLTPTRAQKVKVPMVKEAPAHMECVHHKTVELPGHDPESVHHMVIGRVVMVHINDEFINNKGLVDITKIKPIARLGYMDYCAVDEVFSMKKRTVEEKLTPKVAAE